MKASDLRVGDVVRTGSITVDRTDWVIASASANYVAAKMVEADRAWIDSLGWWDMCLACGNTTVTRDGQVVHGGGGS